MNEILNIFGTMDASIDYIDRPTVKVVIKNEERILILNGGLLPGGGVDDGERDIDAIKRELEEELGASVENIHSIGTVIQYRNLLSRKYLVKGYLVDFVAFSGETKPQDKGEAAFMPEWVTLDEALKILEASINEVSLMDMDDDANQGRLCNLMTSRELILAVN